MRVPFPTLLVSLSPTLALLACVAVTVPDAGEVEKAFAGAGALSCKPSAQAVLSPVRATMSSASFAAARSGPDQTDVVGTVSARLSATEPMRAFSDLSDSVSSRITLDAAAGAFQTVESPPETAPKKLSARDLKGFLEVFQEDALNLATYTDQPAPGTPAKPSLAWIFKKYFAAYVDGKFVDRNGKKYSEPEIKEGIPNAVIVAPLAIFLEAFFDLKLNYPILVEGDGSQRLYYPAGNKNEPTAATLELDGLPVIPIVKIVDDDTNCGITKREAKAIGFGSKLAASKSTILSGLVLETFGDIEVAFVVGGNFSVGDNETFATLVKTMFEVAARRLSERAMYDVLYTYRIPIAGAPLSERQRRVEAFLSDF